MNIGLIIPLELETGWTIALVGLGIVFAVLLFLSIMFMLLPKALDMYFNKMAEREGRKVPAKTSPRVEGNVNAAIAMALHLYMNDMHDEESNIVTIKKITKNYSPWSSKIYGVMNQPVR